MRTVQVAKQARDGRFMERTHTGEDEDCEEFLTEALNHDWELIQSRELTPEEEEAREARAEWVAFMKGDFSVPAFSEVKVGDTFRFRSERELIVGGFWPLITAIDFYSDSMIFCYGKVMRGVPKLYGDIGFGAEEWAKLVASGDIRHRRDPSLPRLY